MAKTQSKSKSNSSHAGAHRTRPHSSQQQRRSKRQEQPQSGNPLEREAAATLKRLQTIDPGLKQLLAEAYGYVVFPKVGKAALVIGGAYGRGAVFERGKLIGFATIGQTTIGVQIGGDTFTELLVFEDRDALERFKRGRLTFAASASAVLVKAGAAATADYEKGVTAFAYADGGMLLEAAIGGQKLRFKPVSREDKQGQQGKADRGSSEEESRESDEDQDQENQQDSEGGGPLQMIKRHPFASGLVGIAALAGAAYFAARAIPSDWWKDEDSENNRAEDSDESESDEEGSEEDDQAEDAYEDEAQDEYEEQDEDSGEGEEAEDDYDDDAEGRRQDENESDEDEESGDPDRGKSRRNKDSSRQRHSWR